MISEIKNLLNEGGTSMNDDMTPVIVEEEPIVEPAAEPVVEEPAIEEPAVEEPAAEPVVEEPADPAEPATKEPVNEPAEPVAADPVAEYNLEEIAEYVELRDKYAALENNYNALVAEKETLENSNKELVEFKATIEKDRKKAMIKSFYMLSDDIKQEFVDNIDSYSLEDLEAKLSILCVRNKVNFNLEETPAEEPTVYDLNDVNTPASSVPEWIKSLRDNKTV